MLLAIDVGNTNTVSGAFDGDEARRLVAGQDRLPDDRRRDGAAVARAARPAQRGRRHRGLLDGAGGAARAARAARALLRRRAVGHRRARRADRRAAALRQPARGRRRPHRQHAWPRTTSTAARRRRRLRHVDQLRRRLGRGRVPRRRARARHRDLHRRARRPRRRGCSRSSWRSPRSVIGKTTVEALQSGLLYGFAGQVDGIVRRIIAELGGTAARSSRPAGSPRWSLDESETIQHHEPDLTLIGLRLVYERNPDLSSIRSRREPRRFPAGRRSRAAVGMRTRSVRSGRDRSGPRESGRGAGSLAT